MDLLSNIYIVNFFYWINSSCLLNIFLCKLGYVDLAGVVLWCPSISGYKDWKLLFLSTTLQTFIFAIHLARLFSRDLI